MKIFISYKAGEDGKAIEWPYIVLLVVNVLLLLINILGNTTVCLIIHKNRRIRNARDLLLFNLACADIGVGVFMAPVHIFSRAYDHPTGQTARILCKFITSGAIGWLTSSASIFTLTVLAVERYLAITRPLILRAKFTNKRARQIIKMCWMYATLFNLPLFFVFDYHDTKGACYENWPTATSARIFSTTWFLFQFFIPVTLMVVLYSCVVHRLWFTRMQMQQPAVFQARRRVTKMVVTVTLLYFLCWAPETSWYMTMGADWDTGTLMYAIFECLLVLNSSINPVIYCLCSKRFRDRARKIFKCDKLAVRFNRVDYRTTTANSPIADSYRLTVARTPCIHDKAIS